MVLSMDRWVGKVAIVTGASGGIGASIAEELTKAGIIVVGLARRSEKIEALSKRLTVANAKGKLYAVKADISKEKDILSAFQWVKKNVGLVHILVNNAGVVQPTNLFDGDTEMWRKVLDTNVLGLCIATREAIKVMRENGIDGHIVHINSILGHQVFDMSFLNVYPGSKHAITALKETLRLELNRLNSKIKITSVSPGLTSTELGPTNNLKYEDELNVAMRTMPALLCEDIADGVLYSLSTPPHVQVYELIIKPVNEKL